MSVSGRVTSEGGDPIEGVAVRVLGTDILVYDDADGRYSLIAAADGVLVLTARGYRVSEVSVGGRRTLDVVLEPSAAGLDDILATGYAEQRRGDITGAVSYVDVASTSRQNTTSVLKRLAGRAAGVTVEASGVFVS